MSRLIQSLIAHFRLVLVQVEIVLEISTGSGTCDWPVHGQSYAFTFQPWPEQKRLSSLRHMEPVCHFVLLLNPPFLLPHPTDAYLMVGRLVLSRRIRKSSSIYPSSSRPIFLRLIIHETYPS